MRLPTHGRYDFSPITDRPQFEWRPTKRLAVYIAVNVEWYAFGEGMKEELAPGGPEPDVLNFAWADYGNRVAVWRLLDLFDQLELPVALLVNSALYEYAPAIPAAFRARGDEIVAHGRTNSEAQGTLEPDAEQALIQQATDEISAHEGERPKGWLGPWLSESRTTPELLKAAGYAYTLDWCMDDQPVWLRTDNGPLLAMPYPLEANDANAVMARKMNADAFADLVVDQFDEMLEQTADGVPLVMSLALHPCISGQPFRLRRLRQALQHIARHREQIWLTHPAQIGARFREAVLATL
ncbi:MAG: polysaccharide deacetylase family protein [Pseudomonadota bacterium]